MGATIRVAILEDHQSVIDGYFYRLERTPDIEVTAVALFGAEMEQLLEQRPVDVLLLDMGVRTAPEDPAPYPALETIPRLLATYERLAILVISMYAEPLLVGSAIAAGASGYVLKEDQTSIQNLAGVIRAVATGDAYFSQTAHNQYLKYKASVLQLTQRQAQLLSLCVAHPHLNSQELARKLKVSPSTVRNLLAGIYGRLGVHNRAAAILKARQLGLIGPLGG